MTSIEQSPLLRDDLFQRIDVAQNALRNAAYVGLRRTDCRFVESRLVLSGSVSSFYLKQMAQTLALQALDSAVLVDNQLEVECEVSTDLEILGKKNVFCRI